MSGLLSLMMLSFVLLPALAPVSQAIAADDAATCEHAAVPEAIAACSRLIAASRDKGSGLARLYRSRCEAFNRDHEPEKALADCSEALRLDAGLIAARTGRGDSYKMMRDFDRAIT